MLQGIRAKAMRRLVLSPEALAGLEHVTMRFMGPSAAGCWYGGAKGAERCRLAHGHKLVSELSGYLVCGLCRFGGCWFLPRFPGLQVWLPNPAQHRIVLPTHPASTCQRASRDNIA